MAVRDIDRHGQEVSDWKRLLGQLSRYDLVLAAIPLIFAFALASSVLVPVSLHVAVGLGAVLGGVFVADALYFNPPTADTEPSEPVTETTTGATGPRTDEQ